MVQPRGFGGLHQVNYKALVPEGYDAGHPSKCQIKERRALGIRLRTPGVIVVVSEVVNVRFEYDSTAKTFADHVCTDTGRKIPKAFIIKNPRPDQLLLLGVKTKEKD